MSDGGIVLVLLAGLMLFAAPVALILWSWWWVFDNRSDDE